MRRWILIVMAICLWSGWLTVEASPQSESLTLERCVSIALEKNPLIHSSQQLVEASLARVHQAKAWDQPSLDIDSDLQPRLMDLKRSGESYLGFSQNLPFPGKRSLRGKIASKEVAEVRFDVELLKLDIILQVKQAFFDLLLAQEKYAYAEQDLNLAKDFLNKARLKHEAGGVAQVEVLRARVEASKAANSLQSASNGKILARARLNFLMARKKYDPLEVAGNLKRIILDLSPDDLKAKALIFRPEIGRINASMEKESLKKDLGSLGYWPDFNLGLSRHRLEGQKTTWDFTFSIPIPLFFWQPQQGEIAEARAMLLSLQKDHEHLKNTILLEVEEAALSALTAGRQIRLFEEEILTQAEEVYNMMLFSYQEGEIGGIELIEARRTLIEARKSYADALCNYSVALAVLERSVGRPIEGGTHD